MEEEKRYSKNLMGKTVVGNISFESRTGELMQIVLKNPTSYIDNLDIEQDAKGKWMVPFSSVIAVGDFVVVAEEDII